MDVRLLDIDAARLAMLRQGRAPIHEPLLDDLLVKVLANGTLVLHDDAVVAMRGAAVIMIAVGTPPLGDGRADLTQVRAAFTQAVRNAGPETVIVIKSTVPPGTTASLQSLCRRNGRSVPLTVCPEFLAEGSAVRDFRQPPQVVIGGDDRDACERVARLFGHLDAPIRITDSTSAELIKYGVNAFLAMKISFINEMAQLCEFTGADVSSVADGIGTDERIGRAFLGAGLGFGGSCFPKDVRALDQAASYHGQSFLLLRAAVEVNQQARSRFVAKIQRALNGKLAKRRIAVLGLAFKPGTDDVRQAASIDVIRHLEDLGASVVATDPVAGANARPLLPNTELVDDPYRASPGPTRWSWSPSGRSTSVSTGREWDGWCAGAWSSTGATAWAPTRSSSSASRTSGSAAQRASPRPQKRSRLPARGHPTCSPSDDLDSVSRGRDRRRGFPRIPPR